MKHFEILLYLRLLNYVKLNKLQVYTFLLIAYYKKKNTFLDEK
jgi:hypothetical protein